MFVVLFASIILWPLSNAIAQDEFQWSQIDRIGLYQTPEDGQLTPDIWKGYSQSKALIAINRLPDRLSNPQYRALAQKLLLSESKISKDDVDSPALLTARINRLIGYGLFNDAIALHQKAKDLAGNATDFDMSLIDIQMTLMNGTLAPVCLDIQANSNNFRNMPAWRELSDFCLYRFNSRDKMELDSLSFKAMPVLSALLKNDVVDIRESKTNLGTFIAFMDNKISPQSYNDAARTLNDLSDLKIKLALDKKFVEQASYQCYVIEAAKRGILNTKELEMTYQAASFPNDMLNSNSGAVTLHPCAIPAFFYQRLKIAQSPEESKNNINAMMDVTRAIPAMALAPMAKDIETYVEPDHQWRAAVVMGLSSMPIPDSFDNRVWPLQSLQKTNQIRNNDYNEWLNKDNHAEMFRIENRDPALPLYISKAVTSDFNNFKPNNENNEYEKLFSLTYAKKSLHLGLGFNDFMRLAHNNKDTAALVSHILSIAGQYDVKSMHPRDTSVILSGYKAFKLDKEAVIIAFDYLQ